MNMYFGKQIIFELENGAFSYGHMQHLARYTTWCETSG